MGHGKERDSPGRDAAEIRSKRKPTAVPSGNRHAALLGERLTQSRHQPSVWEFSKGNPHAERAEADPGPEPLAKDSARYQVPLSRKTQQPAHAVSSRLTSWAFWFDVAHLPRDSF